jgi:hypothetical protein
MRRAILSFLLLVALLPAARAGALDAAALKPFLTEHCLDCHDSDTKKGGLDLEHLTADPANFAEWVKVFDRTESGEMPPPKKSHLDPKDAAPVLASLKTALAETDANRQQREGRVGVRRLSRVEFENTLRDLLGLPGLRVLSDLPADGKSHGFDRCPAALDFSFVHMAKYLGAVDAALDAATPVFLEKPPVFTYRWSPWTEPWVAQLTKQQEAIPLIGLLRDETFIGAYPNVYDDEPKATAIGVFRHGDADFRYLLRPFTPVLEGFHKIRFCGYSFGWDGEKPVPTDRHGAVAFGVHSTGASYGIVDVPPNQPGISELTAWLDRGGGMTHGVSDTVMFTPESCERLRDYAYGANAHVRGPLKPAPGVAIEWIEFEGPIIDQWPPLSQKALFGDLPVAEWSKESGRPKPAQQTWTRTKHPTSQPPDIYGERGQNRPIVEVLTTDPERDARRLLAAFLRRAFRRPVAPAELDHYTRLVSERLATGEPFQDSLKAAYRAALTSPDALLLRLDNSASFASRLSYFLWSGPPDEELLALAEKGSLAQPAILRAQAGRMLKDPKFQRFIDDFTGQWLRLRGIDATQPDKQLYPEFTPLLQDSMVRETRAYFAELLQNDLGVRHFVKSDFAMLNEPLARHYGIPGVEGMQIRRVPLPAGSLRGPFITQGAILKVTANGTTTSPVTRGAFVLEKILGIVPTPPPPGTGSIEPDTRGSTTIREQLEKHKTNATCAGCHRKMDPYGFALEAFDVMGERRENYRATGAPDNESARQLIDGKPVAYHFDKPVDPTGELPDGRTFHNLTELRDLLAANEEQLARAFLGHLITYATGAPVSFADRAEIERILARSEPSHYGLRTLLLELTQSPLFAKP